MVRDKSHYEEKFRNFIRMCEEAKESGVKVVLVHHPNVLGDNYEEIVESLSRLAQAELHLAITSPAK